jgi:hypothetical protein
MEDPSVPSPMMDAPRIRCTPGRLGGLVAVITGASTGIGAGVARLFPGLDAAE